MINGFEYFPRCCKLKPKNLNLVGPAILLLKDKLLFFFHLLSTRLGEICSATTKTIWEINLNSIFQPTSYLLQLNTVSLLSSQTAALLVNQPVKQNEMKNKKPCFSNQLCLLRTQITFPLALYGISVWVKTFELEEFPFHNSNGPQFW